MILGYYDVRKLLANTLGRWIPAEQFETRVLITDDAYRTATWNFIRGIVLSEKSLWPEAYRSEVYDCEDFALHLKLKCVLEAGQTTAGGRTRSRHPFAVGWLCTTIHAVNFFLGTDGNRPKLRLLDLVSERELNVTDYRQIGRFLQLGKVSVSGKGQVENIIRMVYI